MTGPRAASRPHQHYLPAMGRQWLLPLYDPFSRLVGAGRVHQQLLDRAEIRPGLRVLGIGCGTGNLLRALLCRQSDVDAVGIDPDQGALRLARRKAARAKLPIGYEVAFAGDLPLPDASVDRVLSAFMLHHLTDEERASALREVRRVLRPGGQFHVVSTSSTSTVRPRATEPDVCTTTPGWWPAGPSGCWPRCRGRPDRRYGERPQPRSARSTRQLRLLPRHRPCRARQIGSAARWHPALAPSGSRQSGTLPA
ncbi:class I SAM-dependent methyltransferase [Solwaraspora sp. WMMD937]|nr:class I SAM-dependent methyltransferase [Solwaraspora sp. WMMD937]WFE21900.1 class I SAM-dependent methyltransferase [Solwaraspora sp. WMMD937]